jgi:hypothetical protein
MGNIIKLIEALAWFGSVVVVGIGVWGFFFSNKRRWTKLSLDGLRILASKVSCRCDHVRPSLACEPNRVRSQKNKRAERRGRSVLENR